MSAEMEHLMDDPIEIALAEKAIALAKSRAKWNSIKDFYRPIINALQRLGLEPTLGTDIDLSFAGDAHKLASVVRILRTSGFTTLGERPKKGDTAWHAYFEHPECATKLWLYFTSSVCKRVKTGTQMVEQDVYEVQCGDISMPEEPTLLTIVPPVAALEAEEIPF